MRCVEPEVKMSFDRAEFSELLEKWGFKIEIREQRDKLTYVVYEDIAIFDSEEKIFNWLKEKDDVFF